MLVGVRESHAAEPPQFLQDTAESLLAAQYWSTARSNMGKQIKALNEKVDAGGRQARDALARLVALSSLPNAKPAMRSQGVEKSASKLLSSRTASHELKGLAGSVLTILGNMPVSAETADDKTGSFGRVDIIVPRPSRLYRPDATILQLDAGVSPSFTEPGFSVQAPVLV